MIFVSGDSHFVQVDARLWMESIVMNRADSGLVTLTGHKVAITDNNFKFYSKQQN